MISRITIKRSVERKKSIAASSTSHYLYAIKYEDGGRDSLFKVGKTCNLDQRLRAYRTLIPDGKWFYTIKCTDMHYSEKILHGMLKQRGYHVQREIFRGKGAVIKGLMDLVRQIDRLTVQSPNKSLASVDGLTANLQKINHVASTASDRPT